MSQAVICPVCSGSGVVPESSTAQTACPTTKPCHGCGGKGWVEVGVSYPPALPYVPTPWTCPPYQPYWNPYHDPCW
jgi:hypothetical protein